MQIALNMDHDPTTSAEVRSTLQQVARRSAEQLRTLIRATLGPATSVPDLTTTVFLALRGFVLSQLLLDTMTYDTVVPESDRVARQRRLLAKMLAPYLEDAVRSAEK
jgi:hypothetical protein